MSERTVSAVRRLEGRISLIQLTCNKQWRHEERKASQLTAITCAIKKPTNANAELRRNQPHQAPTARAPQRPGAHSGNRKRHRATLPSAHIKADSNQRHQELGIAAKGRPGRHDRCRSIDRPEQGSPSACERNQEQLAHIEPHALGAVLSRMSATLTAVTTATIAALVGPSRTNRRDGQRIGQRDCVALEAPARSSRSARPQSRGARPG